MYLFIVIDIIIQFHVMSQEISQRKEIILFILSISYLVREYAHIHLLNKNKNSSPKKQQPQVVVLPREQERVNFLQNRIIIIIVMIIFFILYEFLSLSSVDHDIARNIIHHLKPLSYFRKQDCRGNQHLETKGYTPRCLAKK